MCKKLIYLISFVLVLSLAGNVQAIDRLWTGAVDNDWFTAGNWDPSGVPTSDDSVDINLTPGPTIASGVTAAAYEVAIARGAGTTGAMTMTGGTLVLCHN